jgi:hypothetical protein
MEPEGSFSVSIVGSETREGSGYRKRYTVFEIQVVSTAGFVWSVERRFREFEKLHKALAPQHGLLSCGLHIRRCLRRLDRALDWSDLLDPAFVEERRVQLSQYLNQVLSRFGADPKPECLLDFLAWEQRRPAAGTVVVSMISGKRLEVHGSAVLSVRDLKEKINQSKAMPPVLQRLFCGAREVTDEERLVDLMEPAAQARLCTGGPEPLTHGESDSELSLSLTLVKRRGFNIVAPGTRCDVDWQAKGRDFSRKLLGLGLCGNVDFMDIGSNPLSTVLADDRRQVPLAFEKVQGTYVCSEDEHEPCFRQLAGQHEMRLRDGRWQILSTGREKAVCFSEVINNGAEPPDVLRWRGNIWDPMDQGPSVFPVHVKLEISWC